VKKILTSSTAIDFKKAFCSRFHCPPEHYSQKATLYFYYPHASVIARLIYRFYPHSLCLAIQAVELMANARTRHDVGWVVKYYRYQLRANRVNWWVRWFHLRLSGRRMLYLYDELYSPQSQPSEVPSLKGIGYRET
jgi:hypothetical protein